MNGLFLTGTDTGIGKTTYARELMRRHPDWTYWKPVQTGWPEDDDTKTVAAPQWLPGLRYRLPISPHLAAEEEGETITLERILEPVRGYEGALLAEGAGGLLVPLAPNLMQTDLIAALGLPVVVVARDMLGTINHTLLTLDALRNRGLEVKGVHLWGGEKNRAAIERYGDVEIL